MLVVVGSVIGLLIFASLFVAGAKLAPVVYAIPALPVITIALRAAARDRALGKAVIAARYSFVIGAWLCISLTRPALPKSISDIADSPIPDTSSTRPRPYLSWVTRSPASSTTNGRLPADERAGDGLGVPNRPAPLTGADNDGAVSVRRQSISSCGISRRNRDSGLSIGCPHDERTFARLT